MTTPATTPLEQIREDQALGAAWRRAEAALPEGGWHVRMQNHGSVYFASSDVDGDSLSEHAATPTDALNALAKRAAE